MNAPRPKFMIEAVWRGRVFGSDWRSAVGGSLDVLEPATGATLTRVGNAVAEDVRRAAAEARGGLPPRRAPRSPHGPRRHTRSAPPCCATPPARSRTTRKS